MFLGIGRFLTILLLCCLWALYALNVSAQEKQLEQSPFVQSLTKTLKSEPETEIKKSPIEMPLNSPDVLQKSGNRERNISEDESGIVINEDKNESSNTNHQREISGFKYNFRSTDKWNSHIDFKDRTIAGKQFSFRPPPADSIDKLKNSHLPDDSIGIKREGFRWGAAIRQSMIFLAVQHGYALTQPKTREALKGNFFSDYAESVKSLRGWDDGGRFFTNYIAHPMQGSLTGFIYVQNDPKAIKQQFGKSGDYWRSRMKAMAWSAVWSTQFEIGPISQASIGNIGLQGKQTWEDIVVTPTLGTAMLITEDAVDRFIMQRIERKTDNFYIRIFFRMLFSPTRLFANMLRFKTPWYRDRPYLH